MRQNKGLKIKLLSTDRGSIPIVVVLFILGFLFLAFQQMDYRTRQTSKLTIDTWLNQQIEESWTSELLMALSDSEICYNYLKHFSPSINGLNLTNSLPKGLYAIQKIKLSRVQLIDDPNAHQIIGAQIKLLEIQWSRTDSTTQRFRTKRIPLLIEGGTGQGLISCRSTWFVEGLIEEEYICKLFGKVYQYGKTSENDKCII